MMTSALLSSLLEVCPHGAWVTEDVAIELLEGVVESSEDLQRLHLEGKLPNVQVEHGSRVEAPSPYDKYRYFFVNSTKVTWPIVDLGDWLKLCAKLSITCDDSDNNGALEESLTMQERETIHKLCNISNTADALESLRRVKTIISVQGLRKNEETTAAAVSLDDDEEDDEAIASSAEAHNGEHDNPEFHYGMAAFTTTNDTKKKIRARSIFTPKLPPGYTMKFVHDELRDQFVRRLVRSDSFETNNINQSNIEMIKEEEGDEDASVSTTSTTASLPLLLANTRIDEYDRDQDAVEHEDMAISAPPPNVIESKEESENVGDSVASGIAEEPPSEQEDIAGQKYRKMLQMGIPLVAIEFGMAINGVNPDVMTSVLEAEDSSEQMSFSDDGLFVPQGVRVPSDENLEEQYYVEGEEEILLDLDEWDDSHGWFVPQGVPLGLDENLEERYYVEVEEEILLDLDEWDDPYFIIEEEVISDEDMEEIEVSTDEEWDEEEMMTTMDYQELMTIEETIAEFEEGEWTTDEEDAYDVEEDVIMIEGGSDDEIIEEEIVDCGLEVSSETIAAIEKVFANRKNPTKYIILQGPNKDEKKKTIEKLLARRLRESTESAQSKLSKEEKKAAIEKMLAKRRQQAQKSSSKRASQAARKAALEKLYARRKQLAKMGSPEGPSKEAKKAALENLLARQKQEAKKAALEKLYRKRRGRNKKAVPQDASTDAKKAALATLLDDQWRNPRKMIPKAPVNTDSKKAALERFYVRRRSSSKKAVPYDASTAAKMTVLESLYAEGRTKPLNETSDVPSTEAKKAAIEKILTNRKSEKTAVKRAALNTRQISSSSVEEILKRMVVSSSDGAIDIEGELIRKIQEAEEVQRRLERQLAAAGVAVAEDIDYDVCMRRISVIGKRMAEIGSAKVVHPDKEKQEELRMEYFKLEQDMAKYSNAMFLCDEHEEKQARLDLEWETENREANVKALESIRRHMPRNISAMDEAELLDEISPNGQVLPPHIVRKMKRSNVLQLIRRNPDDIVRMHPSVLTSMAATDLTITERRAIYEHLRPIGPVFKSLKGKGKVAEKYKWYSMMKENFKEKLATYNSHVEQYGSPGKHQCPLIGRQCPVRHDQDFDYSGDYGWTDQPMYAAVELVDAPDKYDPAEFYKVAEFHSAHKAMHRDFALKNHYHGKEKAVKQAKGSCNTMEAIMSKMEQRMEKLIEDRTNISVRKLRASHDMQVKEAASFNEVLSECKLGIIGMCVRAGMEVSDKETKASVLDPRSALECFLADEVKETFEIFARLEQNAKTVKALGAMKGGRSRILKTEEIIMKEIEEKKRAAEVAVIVGSIKREAKRKSKLRGETRKFLFTLHKYLDCRRRMDAKYLEVDEFQQIAAHPIKVDTPTGFGVEDQQQSINGTPVQNLDELYEAANVAEPIFHDFIDGLIVRMCDEYNHKREGISFVKPDLKSRERSSAKAAHDYASREPGPGISWLYDIVRGSIEFESATQVVQFVDLIVKEESIRVIKAKNRFKNPTLTGYRDLNIQFQLKTEHGFSHICEIQIHHVEIRKLNKELKSHDYYAFFRHYFAGATSSLEDRLDDLKLISQGGDLDDYLLNELLERNKNERRLERLGVLCEFSLCEYHFALGVYGKLFEIRLEKHGPRHPLVAKTYTNMANVLQKQGKLDEAMELYKASQQINMRTHGEKHESLATTYEQMAMILKEQDKLDDAIKYFEKALEINQELHGEQHSTRANTYNNIAVVYQLQGKLDEAVDLHQKSLNINKELFGDMHWAVARTYSNMALILLTQSKLEESMKLYKRSLEIYVKTLGERHSEVAKAYFKMARVLKAQSDLDGAMKFYSKSLDIDQKNLGEMHPSVARTYQSMALILQDQGKDKEAMEMYDKSLDIKRKLSFERSMASMERSMASNMRRKRRTYIRKKRPQ